jgi:hypothetical protein
MYLYVLEETIKSLWFCVLSLYILLLTPFPGRKKRKYAGICRHTVNYVYGEKERVMYEKDPEPMPISQTHTYRHKPPHTHTHRPACPMHCEQYENSLRPRSDDRYVCSAYMAPKIRYLAPTNPPSNILTIQKIRNVAKTRNVNKHLKKC